MDRIYISYVLATHLFFPFEIYLLVQSSPLESLVPLIQQAILLWNISTHSVFSKNMSDNVSCSRSFLYLSSITLSSPSLCTPISTPSFLNLSSLLSSTINTPYFSFLQHTILSLLHLQLQLRPYSIDRSLKVLYSRKLTLSSLNITLSLIFFILH